MKKILILALILFAGCAGGDYSALNVAEQSNQMVAQLKPGPQVTAMANNPAPPADAQQQASVGEGSMTMGTNNSPDDTDFYWEEAIDVDGNGDIETADLLWDDEDKILLVYYEDDFTCDNGAPGSGSVLMAINGADNLRGRPAGSGFYIISLDESECGAQEAALWGCKFDGNGNDTACGVAALDEKNDDLTIVTASE